ncbi:hypothetical protein HID58_069760 [Brassica napus]|uniref:Uncharacterized protein n=1 Tax=Brassica napus TaxID=3708 RepID=A0ABQ7YWY5_BRANA|nr:hypothetical protein HID58_069760 [Brassica napus]
MRYVPYGGQQLSQTLRNPSKKDEHGYDAYESCKPNTEEEGSEECYGSEGDLKDYQEYLQNNHKSGSESSAESD